MSDQGQRVRGWLDQAATVTVLTGAGMSAESGIATFRGGDHGLWSRFDPAQLATPEAFRADPDLVWAWYRWRMGGVRAAQPHAGHRALAELAGRGSGWSLITQNVDDLHERAGSRDVIHLHGELFATRCFDCADPMPDAERARTAEPRLRLPPPRCAHCGGPARPGVVWFGEELPAFAWQSALRAAQSCDLLLVVGTSGVVHPAAMLPELARQAGARIVEINPVASAITPLVDLHWPATAAQALPGLLQSSPSAPIRT